MNTEASNLRLLSVCIEPFIGSSPSAASYLFKTRTPGIFITLERSMYHFWYKRGIPLLKCRWRLILAYFCFKGLFRPHKAIF